MPSGNNRDQDNPVFEMTRTYDASRDAVWKAWSDAAELARWWGPKGCKLEVLRHEFKPGGFFHYAMNYDGAPPMWGRFCYREIFAPQRLVWLNSFANERCGIARAPFSPDCPMEILNSVDFEDRAGQTVISLRATPFGALDAERKYFDDLRPSLEQGYGGTLDQLADHLKR